MGEGGIRLPSPWKSSQVIRKGPYPLVVPAGRFPRVPRTGGERTGKKSKVTGVWVFEGG